MSIARSKEKNSLNKEKVRLSWLIIGLFQVDSQNADTPAASA